jgi:RimJ/RimL family protein N-acetyltransferase
VAGSTALERQAANLEDNRQLGDEIQPLLAFGFETFELNRIDAEADPRNVASLKILLSHGFKQEGLMRENWIYRDEKPSDTAILGLLRREWRAS